MSPDPFRHRLRDLVRRSEESLRALREEKRREEERHQESLLFFDRHADRIQEEIVAPRIASLASLFDHAFEPEMAEGHEYRHRIHLHFGHTPDFPCTADVTFLLVHGEGREFLKVKFEYLILPAYVTERYKMSDTLQVPLEEGGYPAVRRFVESRIETFLLHYLKARRA